jgi:hypothetical protein
LVWWAGSPYNFNNNNANEFDVNSTGNLNDNNVNNANGARPVFLLFIVMLGLFYNLGYGENNLH